MTHTIFRLALLLMFAVFLSCSNLDTTEIKVDDLNRIEYKKTHDLKFIRRYRLPLNESTGFTHSSMAINSFDGDKYLSFLNELDNSLYIYALEESRLLSTTKFDIDGPNGVGRLDNFAAAHLVSDLNNFILLNSRIGTVFRLDSQGNILNKFVLNVEREFQLVPEAGSFNPMLLLEENLYISNRVRFYRNDYSDLGMITKINLKDSTNSGIVGLPELYNQAFWGAEFRYHPNVDYNSRLDSIVISFPLDSRVYLTDRQGMKKIAKKSVGSEYSQIFTAFDDDPMLPMKPEINEMLDRFELYTRTESNFSTIKYDEINDLYYRVFYIRPTKREYENGKITPDFSVILMDKNFTKIGEKRFSGEEYRPTMTILSDGGIYLANQLLYNQDEDHLTYDYYGINEIN